MLSAAEKSEIDHEIAKFPVRRSACLEALMIVQKHRGYISDESLRLVADYMQMSDTELDGITTFYNLIYRKPVGKKVIRICDSVSCFIMGYEQIRTKITEELGIQLGQTTPDNEYTLLPTPCLGTCDRAPALMINDELHRNLSEESVVQILRS
ncbi:MAG: NADH-quinone oxidoreductase subunit NuoE [Myxococcota bacterium]